MSTDKRTVTTDALETLGQIISINEKRDAIHLAVEPAVAVCTLRPGEDVGFVEGGVGPCKNPVGIVDPFVKGVVSRGERFWLVVYPRQITSLRHVWTHPAFEDQAEPTAVVKGDDKVATSGNWIQDFADSINQSYDELMQAAKDWVERNEYTYDNTESYKGQWEKFPEFWTHYEIVTGKKVAEEDRTSFFTCSC